MLPIQQLSRNLLEGDPEEYLVLLASKIGT